MRSIGFASVTLVTCYPFYFIGDRPLQTLRYHEGLYGNGRC
jgi:hypothetical protein